VGGGKDGRSSTVVAEELLVNTVNPRKGFRRRTDEGGVQGVRGAEPEKKGKKETKNTRVRLARGNSAFRLREKKK